MASLEECTSVILFAMNNVALITGWSRGIGFEVARQLAARDSTVIVTGRTSGAAVAGREEDSRSGPGKCPRHGRPCVNCYARGVHHERDRPARRAREQRGDS